MDFPRFTDMRGIERDLSGDPAYAKLGKAIRLATLAQSCKSDLAQAVSCCSALRALLASPRKRGTLERSTTENALLFTAVSLYGRATATVGKDQERGSINISAKLSADQLLDHTALVALRNRGLGVAATPEALVPPVISVDRERRRIVGVERAAAFPLPAGPVKLHTSFAGDPRDGKAVPDLLGDHRKGGTVKPSPGVPLKPREGQFLGGLAFDANPMTDKQRNWLVILLDKHGLPPLADGGDA